LRSYDALRQYLQKQTDRIVVISFAKIASIIGESLPGSACDHDAWWNSSGHSHARKWEESGYKAINIKSNRLHKQMEFMQFNPDLSKHKKDGFQKASTVEINIQADDLSDTVSLASQDASPASSSLVKKLILDFFEALSTQGIDVYNEFSLQHELGVFLRSNLVGYKVQFERNVSYFYVSSKTIKKEIDIAVFLPDRSELYAIELKYPRNGQHPEQMFSFVKDIKFMEELKKNGFTNTYAVTLVSDKLFYEGVSVSDIYRYFRYEYSVYGRITKPTGKKDEVIVLDGVHNFEWKQLPDGQKFYIIEV